MGQICRFSVVSCFQISIAHMGVKPQLNKSFIELYQTSEFLSRTYTGLKYFHHPFSVDAVALSGAPSKRSVSKVKAWI